MRTITVARTFAVGHPSRIFRRHALGLALLALVAGCSRSTTSPNDATSGGSSGLAASKASPTLGALPGGNGEFTLTPPAGMPVDGSCISINAIPPGNVDWVIQALPNHPNTIGMSGVFFHEPTPGCDTTDLDAVARPLFLIGPKVTYAPGETGTSTLRWTTDRRKDGGHFGISVWALREVPSEGDGDRVSTLTVVDCGFPTPPGVQ